MKYETPKLTALTPAIGAIQTRASKGPSDSEDNHVTPLPISCYEDNE